MREEPLLMISEESGEKIEAWSASLTRDKCTRRPLEESNQLMIIG
jgi:hypothetical protein